MQNNKMTENMKSLNGELERIYSNLKEEITEAGTEIEKNLLIAYKILPKEEFNLKLTRYLSVGKNKKHPRRVNISMGVYPRWEIYIQPEVKKGLFKQEETGNLEIMAQSDSLHIRKNGAMGWRPLSLKEFFAGCIESYKNDPTHVIEVIQDISSVPYHINNYIKELEKQKNELVIETKKNNNKFKKTIDYISVYHINPRKFQEIFDMLSKQKQVSIINKIQKLPPTKRNEQSDELIRMNYDYNLKIQVRNKITKQ